MDYPEVSLDDVGNAEALLNRLVQERKTLESGVAVLQTYRMVKSQLQPAIEELSAVEMAVSKAKQNLDGIENAKAQAIAKAEAEVDAYRSKRGQEAEEALQAITQSIDDLSKQYDDLQKAHSKAEGEYEAMLDQQEDEYRKVQRELSEMKKEHAALAEAMSRAASVFGVR